MKTRELIKQTLTRRDLSQMKLLTTANIAYKLLGIFQKHIGQNCPISHRQLFRAIFGRGEEITLADDLRWDYVRKAMHMCRQRTKCFIGHKFERGVWYYFVVEDFNDAKYYCNTLEKNIGRMRAAQQKAMLSVRQKWYKLDWKKEANKRLGWSK